VVDEQSTSGYSRSTANAKNCFSQPRKDWSSMANWKGRLFIFALGAAIAGIGYLLWASGDQAGFLIGLIGGACIAMSTMLPNSLFERTINFIGRFW
jgi:hypothetical protein